MTALGQTRPRQPPGLRPYWRPVLSNKRTYAGRPDRGSLGPIAVMQVAAVLAPKDQQVKAIGLPSWWLELGMDRLSLTFGGH